MHAATHAHCTVIAVPGEMAVPVAGQVVVGVDGSELSEAAVAFAFQRPARPARRWSQCTPGCTRR